MKIRYLVYKINKEYKFVFDAKNRSTTKEWAQSLGGSPVLNGYFSSENLHKVFGVLRVLEKATKTGKFNQIDLEKILLQ